MSKLEYPGLVYPIPAVDKAHPFLNEKNHQKLLEYLQKRLLLGKSARDQRIPRYIEIDQVISSSLEKHRRKPLRMHDTASITQEDGTDEYSPIELPITFTHLDDMMTYFAQTFSPTRGMFHHLGNPDDQKAAAGVVTLMNNHAIYGGYYRHLLRAIFDILKYNLGGLTSFWDVEVGPRLGQRPEDAPNIVWQGNRVLSFDMYNTFWDPIVDPVEVYKEGEFFATSKLVTQFWLQRRAISGLVYNVEKVFKTDVGLTNSVYYRHPPTEAQLVNSLSSGSDWIATLSEIPTYSRQSGVEFTDIYIRLNPAEFGLVSAREAKVRRRFEIWHISIVNDEFIVAASHLPNIHDYLPAFFGRVNDDIMQDAQRSVGQIIAPFQRFASHLINAHQLATRKNLWGLTVYDSSVVDLSSIPSGEVNATIAAKSAAGGIDLRKHIWKDDRVAPVDRTMQDLQSVIQILNQFFPTSALPSQIAGIDRAISSQVAAVQQGTNRRNQKTVRLIEDTLMRPLRFSLYYNCIQFQPAGEEIADFRGKSVKLDMEALRQTDLPFIIGQGLMTIDRQMVSEALQTVIFALIQNPQTAQQIDLLALMDYWTDTIDVDIDMRRFQLQPAAPAEAAGAESPPPQPQQGVEP